MAVDPYEYRRALGCFVTGVTVVMTTDDQGAPRGFTANSFSSVSLNPPLVSICIDHGISSYKVFGECSGFSISILSESQREVSNLFASKSREKFAHVAWHTSRTTGSPRLTECVAWFDCVPFQSIDAGDHLILIGKVVDFDYSDRSPLSFCRGNYLTFDLMQQILSERAGQNLSIGAIVNAGERILLVEEAGRWTLPVSPYMGTRGQDGGLHGELRRLGVQTDLNFLYAVFEGPEDGQLSIFYRGETTDVKCEGGPGHLFAYDDIPWDDLPLEAYRSMLRRYLDERRRFEFGIYVGSSETGTVVKSP